VKFERVGDTGGLQGSPAKVRPTYIFAGNI